MIWAKGGAPITTPDDINYNNSNIIISEISGEEAHHRIRNKWFHWNNDNNNNSRDGISTLQWPPSSSDNVCGACVMQ